jgi:hypothetical protein
MKPHIVSVLRIGKKVAVLVILIIALFTVRPFVREQNAQGFPPPKLPDIGVSGMQCFSDCDQTYWSCIQSCCVCGDYDSTLKRCNIAWDCSSCGDCGANTGISGRVSYANCESACFPSYGTGRCIAQNRCQAMAARENDQCMTGVSGECLRPDGTVDASCCNNESVQDYFGCCYP